MDGMEAYPLFSRWRCPKCGGSVIRNESQLVCDGCGNEVHIDADQRRVEWLGDDVAGPIASEIEKYNQWAGSVSITRTTSENRSLWWDGSPGLLWAKKKVQDERGEERIFSGKDVLDIGGSCLDSWNFLSEGANALAQVEPSPESQALGLERLQVELGPPESDFLRKVEFHTATCETLPFNDESFDFVFSRATIHHTYRPQSFNEIYRVLRPAGVALMIEPVLPRVFYNLMWLVRKVRRVDRGTDNPLTVEDVRMMRSRFKNVLVYQTGTGLSRVEWVARKIAAQNIRSKDLWFKKLEQKVGRVPVVSRLFGGNSVIVGFK